MQFGMMCAGRVGFAVLVLIVEAMTLVDVAVALRWVAGVPDMNSVEIADRIGHRDRLSQSRFAQSVAWNVVERSKTS